MKTKFLLVESAAKLRFQPINSRFDLIQSPEQALTLFLNFIPHLF